jgi:hypothetical protein
MKRRCPNITCLEHPLHTSHDPNIRSIVRKGTYYRRSDRRRITRYLCKACDTQFSSSTFHEDYRQKRRDINPKVYELMCSGVSQRRLAKLLQVNPKTVVKKFQILAVRARTEHEAWLMKFHETPALAVQFDDLETSEHTKCKPLSVSLAVHAKTREILGFQVSVMPAKGHLAKRSHKKYGYRKDQRSKGWNELFRYLKPVVSAHAHFESDENPHYPKHLKKHFKEATHQQYPGARGAVIGQGELKKLGFDPLFALNHTCAMLRANLNRLVRRTWCTTKKIQGLIDHLSLYVTYHNQRLLPLHAH